MPKSQLRLNGSFILLDRFGYDFYRDQFGRFFFEGDDVQIHLVTDQEKVDQAAGRPEVVTVHPIDLSHEAKAIEAVMDTARRLLSGPAPVRPTAVASCAERFVVPAGVLRDEFDLAGQRARSATLFRDKMSMKAHVAAHGFCVPEAIPLGHPVAHELLAKYGRLCVKPRLGFGALDIEMVSCEKELASVLEKRSQRLDEFEIEEFIDGRLFHVNSVVRRGQVLTANVGETVDSIMSFQSADPCRNIGQGPSETSRQILSYSQKLHETFSDYTGVTHLEVFLTAAEIVFCEIAARAGGGGIDAGFAHRSGHGLFETHLRAQVSAAVPEDLSLSDELTGYATIYTSDGVLKEAIVPPDEAWVINSTVRPSPGSAVTRPSHWGEYAAMVSVAGSTENEVEERLNIAIAKMTPQVV